MKLTDEVLSQYLDESLPADQAAEVERRIRSEPDEAARLETLRCRRQDEQHALGAIWRRRRLGCPSREVLGGHLAGAISPGWQDYVSFHLEVAECPYCLANLEDLRRQAEESTQTRDQRRRRLFESSHGYFSKA
jgi:hypothetical protein